MKTLAVVLYSIGALIAGFLCFTYFSANAHLSFTIGVNNVAWSSVPMLTLMALVAYVQSQSVRVLWAVPPVVISAAASLFLAMGNHAFPDNAAVWSTVHLVVVVAGGALLVLLAGRVRVSALQKSKAADE